MKTIALILSLLLLTSCSNPDTSGGVTLSRGGGDDGNEFPYGSCAGPGYNTSSGRTGCGWISAWDRSHYIMPGVNLNGVKLTKVDLNYANLSKAKLRGAKMFGTKLREANLDSADLTDAILKRAILQNAQLEYVILAKANLVYADLRGAQMRHADLRNAKLMEADLRDSSQSAIALRHAQIQGADFTGVKLAGQSWSRWHFIERASHYTTCPNGKKWGDPAADCNEKGLAPTF